MRRRRRRRREPGPRCHFEAISHWRRYRPFWSISPVNKNMFRCFCGIFLRRHFFQRYVFVSKNTGLDCFVPWNHFLLPFRPPPKLFLSAKTVAWTVLFHKITSFFHSCRLRNCFSFKKHGLCNKLKLWITFCSFFGKIDDDDDDDDDNDDDD